MPSYAGPPVAPRTGQITSSLRLLAWLALAVELIVLDHRGGWLAQLRQQASQLVQPLWWLAGAPARLGMRLQDDAGTLASLTAENRRLRSELLVANARLTRLGNAVADNAQLRALLGAAGSHGLDVQLAPVLDVDLDPTRQRLVLDAGSADGVQVGQPVIDAGGLLGQIVEVGPSHSTALLLTDPDHAVPVMVQRNGVRLIAYGTGRADRLQLLNVPLNSDVKEGDVVVTSGLGGRFPAGFPVGTVADLHADDNRTFIVGELKPAAQLDRGRYVLLLKGRAPGTPDPVLPVMESGSAQAGTRDPGPGSREKQDQEQDGVDRNPAAVAVDLASPRVPGPGNEEDPPVAIERRPGTGEATAAPASSPALPKGEGLKPTSASPRVPGPGSRVPASQVEQP
ncbi:MAG: rod shape-determining protein MreC [Pseudoxanthomonas sp.]